MSSRIRSLGFLIIPQFLFTTAALLGLLVTSAFLYALYVTFFPYPGANVAKFFHTSYLFLKKKISFPLAPNQNPACKPESECDKISSFAYSNLPWLTLEFHSDDKRLTWPSSPNDWNLGAQKNWFHNLPPLTKCNFFYKSSVAVSISIPYIVAMCLTHRNNSTQKDPTVNITESSSRLKPTNFLKWKLLWFL